VDASFNTRSGQDASRPGPRIRLLSPVDYGSSKYDNGIGSGRLDFAVMESPRAADSDVLSLESVHMSSSFIEALVGVVQEDKYHGRNI
jgi:hypothetical protein